MQMRVNSSVLVIIVYHFRHYKHLQHSDCVRPQVYPCIWLRVYVKLSNLMVQRVSFMPRRTTTWRSTRRSMCPTSRWSSSCRVSSPRNTSGRPSPGSTTTGISPMTALSTSATTWTSRLRSCLPRSRSLPGHQAAHSALALLVTARQGKALILEALWHSC